MENRPLGLRRTHSDREGIGRFGDSDLMDVRISDSRLLQSRNELREQRVEPSNLSAVWRSHRVFRWCRGWVQDEIQREPVSVSLGSSGAESTFSGKKHKDIRSPIHPETAEK